MKTPKPAKKNLFFPPPPKVNLGIKFWVLVPECTSISKNLGLYKFSFVHVLSLELCNFSNSCPLNYNGKLYLATCSLYDRIKSATGLPDFFKTRFMYNIGQYCI